MSVESRKAEILRRRDTLADLRQEVEPYLRLTPEERDRLIQATSRLSRQILLDRTDGARVLAAVDPPSADTESIWRRLMERYRRDRTSPGRGHTGPALGGRV